MVERARLLDGPRATRPGDLVLGLAASGLPSGAVGRALGLLVGTHGLRLDEQPPELACPLGEELLRPERIYVRAVRALLERYRVKGVVHAAAPVAEVGLAGSVAGVLGRRCVARLDRAALPRVPLLDLVRRLGGMSEEELVRAFPMGVGLVAVVAPFYAKAAIRRIRRAGERAMVIGEVAAGNGPAVELA
jgi:phosphoribosylformylglycinamidine cyclo-ligase